MLEDFTDIILHGLCLDFLKKLPDNSVDSIVSDPPYGLGTKQPNTAEIIAYLQGETDLDTGGDFMGKDWSIPGIPVWKECFRVLKPGGHLLAFGGTRTWDLISMGLRAAGFENRDTIADDHPALQWKQGQGFPKSLNVSKAIDRKAGAEREVIGTYRVGGNALTPIKEKGGTFVTGAPNSPSGDLEITAPATEEAEKWDGWGTALKPSWEPILVFRKPVAGTVVDNVSEHGTGAINIDATRVYTDWDEPDRPESWRQSGHTKKPDAQKIAAPPGQGITTHPKGRWPPNSVMTHAEGCRRVGTKKVKNIGGSSRHTALGMMNDDGWEPKPQPILRNRDKDGFEEVNAWECVEGCPVRALDEQTGVTTSGAMKREVPAYEGESNTKFLRGQSGPSNQHGDSGGASRFYPQFEGAPFFYTGKATKKEATLDGRVENVHPTRKPVKLMRWLVKLVTPPGGLVLDPYCGSGSTLVAAVEEGFHYLGFEKDDVYWADACKRLGIVVQEAAEKQAAIEAEQEEANLFEEICG